MDLATLMAFKRELMNQLNTISSSTEQRQFAVDLVNHSYDKLVSASSAPTLLTEEEGHYQ